MITIIIIIVLFIAFFVVIPQLFGIAKYFALAIGVLLMLGLIAPLIRKTVKKVKGDGEGGSKKSFLSRYARKKDNPSSETDIVKWEQ